MSFLTYVEKGNANRVADMLKQGEIANKPNENGVLPLHVAAKQGHASIVEMLLNNNAKPSLKDRQGMTPLHYAARAGHKEIIEILLKQKMVTVDEKDSHGNSALHLACIYKQVGAVGVLVDRGASLDVVNSKAQTALHIACQLGHKQIVDTLLKNGANITLTDKNTNTPFELLHVDRDPQSPLAETKAFEILTKDIKRSLLYNEKYSDVTFVFSNTKLSAHRCILVARAPELLTQEQKDSKEHVTVKPTMTSGAFKFLLEWIYTAAIDLEEVDLDVAIELHQQAISLKLPHLKKFVFNIIANNLEERTCRTVLDVANSFKAYEIVKLVCLFIIQNFKKLLNYHKASKNAKLPVLSNEELNQILSSITIQEKVMNLEDFIPSEIQIKSENGSSSKSKTSGVISASAPSANPVSKKTTSTTVKIPPSAGPSGSSNTAAAGSAVPKDESQRKEALMAGTTLSLSRGLLQALIEDRDTVDFQTPVNLTLYPYYTDFVKRPMDLGTIQKKINKPKSSGGYKTLKEFAADVRLVFENARAFNQPDSEIFHLADRFTKAFEEKYEDLKNQLHFSASFDPPKSPTAEDPTSASATSILPVVTTTTPPPSSAGSKSSLKPPQQRPRKGSSPEGLDFKEAPTKKLPARSKRNQHSSREDSDDEEESFKPSKGRNQRSSSDDDVPTKKSRPVKRTTSKKDISERPKKKAKTESISPAQLEKDKQELIAELPSLLEMLDPQQTVDVISIMKGGKGEVPQNGEYESDPESWTPEIVQNLKEFVQRVKGRHS